MAGNEKIILKKEIDFKRLCEFVCQRVRESHKDSKQVVAFLNELVVCTFGNLEGGHLQDLWVYMKVLLN
jgi:hypothetical protein